MLISNRELFKIIFKNIGKKGFFKILIQSTKVKQINQFYAEHEQDNSETFIQAILNKANIRFTFNTQDLNRIPTQGPFIVIANHPFGGIDGLILYKIFSIQRTDVKIMASHSLRMIKPLKDLILPMDTLNDNDPKEYRIKGSKTAFQHLNEGGCIILFPAGEVASFQHHHKMVTDHQWQYNAIKFIKKANVPVIPVFISEIAEPWYVKWLPKFIRLHRTHALPQELFFRNNIQIQCRIGKIIKPELIQSFESISQLGRFLRVKTYALGSALNVNQFFPSLKSSSNPQEIVPPIDNNVLINEINNLSKDYFLFKISQFKVFCAPAIAIPNVIYEIGRQREITFRQVKEGTNKSIDLDEFDLYYYHLFIWDDDKKSIVGAYRIGKGNDIFSKYGIKGFYIQTLFYIEEAFFPILKQSLELGRSFITIDYQQKPLPLFLLWKGILYFLLKNKEYRYLIGPVSISNSYSKASKALITAFIQKYYFENDYKNYVHPRTGFEPHLPEIDTDILLSTTNDDLGDLDKLIEEIEVNNVKIPVLLKKYLKLNARILGFNIDPLFNDALDGLILLDLYNVPQDVILSLSKEFNDDEILKRFEITSN
ncbi:MAG: GNAT family N-acetyltransferase [Bacteroidales bacterium]|nr:GNAT family N-acetyltransferase [Bacteroidales bacterium]